MKEKRNILVIIFLSAIIGWAAGFLRIPFVDKNSSFLIGFITGLAFVFLILILIMVWKKNTSIIQFLAQKSDSTTPIKNYNFVWTVLAGLILSGSLLSVFFIYQQNEFSKNQLKNQNQRINQQSQLIESTRKSNLVVLMNDIFDKIDDELKNNPKRTLSENTIERIVALNFSFQPYQLLEGDSLSEKKWSPERGQLLISLASMNIDSNSFNQIKRKVSFLGADLRDANLKKIDLSGIDLKNANLKGADLREANLNNAVLSDANLWGANLQKAKLKGSIFHRADFRWADLSEADLRKADLNGANLNDAKLFRTDLQEINLEWSKARNAYLNEANFSEAKLTGTDLGNANLTKTNFSKANMKLVNFSDAILDQTDLSEAELSKATVVEKDWILQLKEKKVINAQQIESTYKTIVEVSGKYNFRLVLL